MKTILIVDDDLISRTILERYLSKWGYDFCMATDGNEAMEVLGHRDVSVIITDWMMPEVDGIALCQYVRQREQGHKTTIIMLTTRDENEDFEKAREAGVDVFLTKPINVSALEEQLNNITATPEQAP